MSKTTCPRCGKKAATKLIPLSGTSRCAEVCVDCYEYLTYSDDAYERFVYLERAKERRSSETKVKKRSNGGSKHDE